MRAMRATIITTALLLAVPASGITRDQVLALAKAYAHHPWRCTSANVTASCAAGYKSVFSPGDYLGVAYDWGGNATLFEFDQLIAQGNGAGAQPADGVLSCTTGVDCSGYVSRCWGESTKYGTSTLQNISTAIPQSQLLAGDVMNLAGTHVVLYSHTLTSGDPVWYEAGVFVTEMDLTGGWSKVSGYTPRRYNTITGTTAGDPAGTMTNPILIGALPYSDSRDTTQSASDVLDGCGAAPTKDESGPEYIYQLSLTQPGNLTVTVSNGPGVDIDVHLYESMNTGDCVARNDKTFTHAVDCGTYHVVADTFMQNPGPYTLTVSFTPSGGSCGSGPPTHDPPGELGDPCAGFAYTPRYCNQTLGSEICISVSGTSSSFCSRACKTVGDCSAFPGGCCKDISGKGEYYCMPAPYCGGTATPDGGTATPDARPPITPDGHVGPALDLAPHAADGQAPGLDREGVSLEGGGGDGGCAVGHGDPCGISGALLALLLALVARRRRPRRGARGR